MDATRLRQIVNEATGFGLGGEQDCALAAVRDVLTALAEEWQYCDEPSGGDWDAGWEAAVNKFTSNLRALVAELER